MSTKSTGRRQGAVYIEPDSMTVVVPAIVGALTVGAVSFAMSWDALQVVATWAGVRRTWGLPVALDAAILVFTSFWLIAKRRGRSMRSPPRGTRGSTTTNWPPGCSASWPIIRG